MEISTLEEKVSEYASSVLIGRAKSWQARFAIGAAAYAMRGRLEPFVRSTGAMNGTDVDMRILRETVMAGFRAAGHVDVFGGLLGFDPSDAEALFDHIGA